MEKSNLPLLAHKKSKEAHIDECWWGKLISEKNVSTFNSFKDALFAGYDSCGHCLSEFNGMIDHGYLIINKPTPSIEGEFILPGIILTFSKESAKDYSSLKVIIGLNKKQFEIIIQKTQDEFELIVNRNKHVSESEEELDYREKDVLELFLSTLNKKYINEAFDIKKHVIPVGRAIMTLLASSKNPEFRAMFQEGSVKSGIISKTKSSWSDKRYEKVKKQFKNKPSPLISDYLGKSAAYFIGNDEEDLDNTNYVHERLQQRCVIIGQSVQAWWNEWIDGKKVWKKAWGIVGGLNADTTFGCSGTDNFAGGDINMFTGWSYAAVDHDKCQSVEDKMLGPCSGEFALGAVDIMARCLNQNLCDGKYTEMYSDYAVSDAELNAGQYSFTEEHPMAGRKINTPADWTIVTDDDGNKLWKGPPLPEITNIKASPNIFDQKTGTTISFDLGETKALVIVTVELFHENAWKIRPAIILKKKECKSGFHQIYWNGKNAHGLPSAIGKFNAFFKINGVEVDKKYDFLTKKINTDTPLPESKIIEKIRVSRNPFSIKTGTAFNFSLKEEATVSIFIYHKTWKRKSIKTVFQNRKLDAGNHGPFNWDGRNDDNGEVTNGEYKIKFVVNGEVKRYEGLQKKAPILVGSTSLPTSKIIENIKFWPNPFTIKSELNFSFELTENANVSVYFYHKNWKNKGIRTFYENNVLKKIEGPFNHTWNGRNNKGVKVTNGEYKIKFVVNGEEKIVKGIKKVWR